MSHNNLLLWCAVPALGLLVSGCATASHTERGALLGGSLGALTGAIIGNQSGESGAGAAIGGIMGAATGALIGNAEDAFEQRDAAVAQLKASSRPLHPPPLTNGDLIKMTQAGLGDEVIINAVNSRGGQFQLDPDGLIALKSSGVSDRVIGHVQTVGAAPPPPPTRVVEPPPGILIVRPQPVIGVHFGHHRHRRRPRPRSGFSISAHHRF